MSLHSGRSEHRPYTYHGSFGGRNHTIMSREDVLIGKKSRWSELEIRGPIRNLSPDLWSFTHLTSLYLNDNSLQVHLSHSQSVSVLAVCVLAVCVCVCVVATVRACTVDMYNYVHTYTHCVQECFCIVHVH